MSSSNSHDAALGQQTPLDHSSPPPLSAAFAIKFDLKVGYSIAWKRSAPGVQLDGSVEFKSLPSGLHTVKEDLVYFIQDEYAGLSAFVNAPAAEEERNASLVAVGILVPLSNARLGRGWLHAKELRELAQTLALDVTKTKPLEQFWDDFKANTVEEAHVSDVENAKDHPERNGNTTLRQGPGRKRALSNLTSVPPLDQTLPPCHPALSMLEFVELFGPLIFPIWRAALLRKRILLMSSPPVRRLCEYVFDISILSNIPTALSNVLSLESENLHRIRLIFQVGIHDIPLLEREAKSIEEAAKERQENDGGRREPFGFIGCTTDEVLQEKTRLYDIIVEIPPIPEIEPEKRQWPCIKRSDGTEIKASHRDLRRWKLLRDEITRLDRESMMYHDNDNDEDEAEDEEEDDEGIIRTIGPDDSEESPLLQRSATFSPNDPGYEDKLIEPTTWSQLAYSGFMWWAAAGERDAGQSDEEDKDRQVLGRLSDYIPPSPRLPRYGGGSSVRRSKSASSSHASIVAAENAGLHTGIIAYFHRLTGQILNTMAEVVESADDDGEEGEEGEEGASQETVHVTSEDLGRMGLDAWSRADVNFVKDALRMYFGRDAEVHSQGIECCGIKVC